MVGTASWQHIKKAECPHLSELKEDTKSTKTACEVCAHTEDLRLCLTCGYVACCESHMAHDTGHFRETGHPFIRPQNCDYNWLWCYKCNAFLD
jgi:uncharacterized UBP type Zn finger protein